MKNTSARPTPALPPYFVTIEDEVVIELMTKPGLQPASADNNHTGWAHLALSVGGAEQVDALAQARRGCGGYWFRRRVPPATAIMRR